MPVHLATTEQLGQPVKDDNTCVVAMTTQLFSRESLNLTLAAFKHFVNVTFPVGMVPSGWQVTVWVLLRESPDSAAGSVQTKDSVSPTAMEI